MMSFIRTLVAWVLHRLTRHFSEGFITLQFCFDPQAPLGKQEVEAGRDASSTHKSELNLFITQFGLLTTRTFMTIFGCRKCGRHTFLDLFATLIKDEAWVAERVSIPSGMTLIITGASRSTLGETVALRGGRRVSVDVARTPIEHAEADTSVICAAWELAGTGVSCLIDCIDYDSQFAGLAGLAAAISDGGDSDLEASKVRAKRIHLLQAEWYLDPQTGQRAKKPTQDERNDPSKTYRSDVLHLGAAAVSLMFDDGQLDFLPVGVARVQFLVWCSAFCGGDTVPRIYGHSPRDGLAAALFLGEKLELPVGEFAGTDITEGTLAAAKNLLKAMAFADRKSKFPVGGGSHADWVHKTSLQDISDIVFEINRDLKKQVLSTDQAKWHAMKVDARYSEWAASCIHRPGLLDSSQVMEGGGWRWADAQLKALYAVDELGKELPGGPAVITAANVRQRYGTGPDHAAMAERIGVDVQGKAIRQAMLTNDDVRILCPLNPDTGQPLSYSRLEAIPGGIARLRENIRAREFTKGTAWAKMKTGGSREKSAKLLYALCVAQEGYPDGVPASDRGNILQPPADELMAAAVEPEAAASAAAEPVGQAGMDIETELTQPVSPHLRRHFVPVCSWLIRTLCRHHQVS